MHPNGTCDFAADPRRTALGQPVFWASSVDPSVIILRSDPAADGADLLTADRLGKFPLITSRADMARLCIQGEPFDVDLSGLSTGEPVGAVITLDTLTPDRTGALMRFWDAVSGRKVPADARLSPQRRRRARQMLRVVDAKAAGATYRAIGEVIFPRLDHDAASWTGSAARETTIRLARDGMKLVRGGYRSLLRRPRRGR